MTKAEKIKLNIVDKDSGELNQVMVELFIEERFEYFLKGVFALSSQGSQLTNTFASGVAAQ